MGLYKVRLFVRFYNNLIRIDLHDTYPRAGLNIFSFGAALHRYCRSSLLCPKVARRQRDTFRARGHLVSNAVMNTAREG